MTAAGGRALAVAVLAAGTIGLAPAAAGAQVFEPFARVPGVRVPVELLADGAAAAPAQVLAARTSGTFRVLVIPALFEDSPEPAVAVTDLADTLFGTTGRTLTTFYQEMSLGALTVTGEIPDWVRTHVTVLEAAGSVDGHGWIGELAGEHFAAAVTAVDPMVDFTAFDNDGPDGVPDSGDDDGYVDAVTFKFTEVAGSCGGPGFWPHRSSLRAPDGSPGIPTADTAVSGEPIRVRAYTTESVTECDGTTPQGPNVMAHEFGHILGLPDYYRAVEGVLATQRHWMVGCFGLMAAGSWGCGTDVRVQGYGPSGLSPLSRDILEWGSPVLVEEVTDAEYVLGPVQTTGEYLKVRLTDDWTEFLLVEYRPRIGFDDDLPAAGVLVYHVDTNANILGGAFSETFPYWLVEADDSDGLRRTLPAGGDRGVPTDVFARDGAVDSLTPATRPATRLASGDASTVWIHAIAVEDDVARVRLTTTSPLTATAVIAPTDAPALEPMTIRFRIQGGVGPYDAVPPPDDWPIPGFSIRMDGDEVVVEGTPLMAGTTVAFPLHVRDGEGAAWYREHRVVLTDAVLSDAELLAPLAAPGSEPDIETYLDASGNADGTYDVGDLRAYVLRTGR